MDWRVLDKLPGDAFQCRVVEKRILIQDDRDVILWDTDTKTELCRIPETISTAIYPDRSKFVTGGADGNLRVFDMDTCQEEVCKWAHDGIIHPIFIFKDGTRLFSKAFDHTVRIWDLQTLTELVVFENVESAYFMGTWLTTRLLGQPETYVYDSNTFELLMTFPGEVSINGRTAQLITGNTVRNWDTTTWTELPELVGHTAEVQYVDGLMDRVYTAADDHTIRIWDSKTGTELFKVEGVEDRVERVYELSKYILSITVDGTMQIWVTESGEEVFKQPRQYSIVEIDEEYIITKAKDFADICVFDAKTGKQLNSYGKPCTLTTKVSPNKYWFDTTLIEYWPWKQSIEAFLGVNSYWCAQL